MIDYWENVVSATDTMQLSGIKCPAGFLSDLLDDEVPDHLYPLVMIVRMLNGFAVYGNEASDKARALRIIELTRKELDDAEHRCQE